MTPQPPPSPSGRPSSGSLPPVAGAPLAASAARPRRKARGLSRQDVARRYQALVELAPDAVVVTDPQGRIRLANRQTEVLFGYPREDLLGQPVERLIPARFHTAHQQHRAAYAAAPHTRPMGTALQLFGRRQDGSEFPVEVSLSPLPGDDQDATFAVVATIRDVSARKAYERERRDLLALAQASRLAEERGQRLAREQAARAAAEQANQELRRLQALTDTALAHLELDDLLLELLGRVREVMKVDNAAILLLDPAERELQVRAAQGLEEEVAAGVRVPLGQGFAGRIAASREPLIVEDLATFPVVSPFLRERLRSAVGVPLVAHGQVLGVLHVGTAEPHHFTPQDVQLLQRAAERVAVAIERSQSFAAEQQARREAQAAQAQAEAAQMRAEAEQARALASEARVRRLVEVGIIGMAMGEGNVVREANDAFLRLLGYTRDDMAAGRIPWFQRAAEEYAAYAEVDAHALQELLATGACTPYEREFLRPDGTRLPVLLGAALLSREPLEWVCFAVNVSERKQLEEEVRWQAHLLNQAHDAMFVWEWGGPIVYWNDGAERLYGYTREDALGKVSHDLLQTQHPLPRAEFEAQLARTGEWTGELVHTTADGQRVSVLSRHQRIRRPDGGHSVLESSSDITELKWLERERAEARASEVAVREVNQHLDEFFTTASHDLRQPIAVAKMQAEMALRRVERLTARLQMRGGPQAEQAANALATLRQTSQSLDRLSRLAVELFDIARARTGTLELHLVRLDLAALVREQVEAQRAATPDRTLRLDAPDEGQPVWVQGDGVRLRQVLTNYLSNALKYSPADKPVEVRVEVVEQLAVVSLRDEGPGLPWEEQSRVWEMLHRAPGVEVQSGIEGSLGLGLYIVKRLVELHPGGRVGVESVVGEGSTFWFRLPLAGAPDAAGNAALSGR